MLVRCDTNFYKCLFDELRTRDADSGTEIAIELSTRV